MKAILFGIAMVAATITACNNDNNSSKETPAKGNDTTVANNQTAATQTNQTASVDDAVTAYLQIKNALANDNGKDAAAGGTAFLQALNKIDTTALGADQKEAAGDAKEMAEHISKNADKIAHQREHFEMLSQDMYDMVKAVGTGKTLYKDFCPMYNNKKGAIWLSETKEIKNPYMGKEMSTCGEVKEEIKK